MRAGAATTARDGVGNHPIGLAGGGDSFGEDARHGSRGRESRTGVQSASHADRFYDSTSQTGHDLIGGVHA